MASEATARSWPRGRPALRAALIAALLVTASGCAAIPWPGAASQGIHPSGDALAPLDLRGVVHVHTRASHDSPGTLEAVVGAARSAGLAWVALAEHARDGGPTVGGRRGGVTLVPGYEFGAEGASLLALGVAETPPGDADLAQLLDWIHGAGGLAFVGHLERSRLADPDRYAQFALDGIELLNLHASARSRYPLLALRALVLPSRVALRPLLATPRANLERWSRLPEAWSILGSVDAHAKFRLLGPAGGTIDRYADVFRLLTTHVVADGEGIDEILDALRNGRSYVALEGLARVDWFHFQPLADGYLVEAPRFARLALVCDGDLADAARGERVHLRPPPGARRCRAEAWLEDKLWIVTSYRSAAFAPVSTRQG